MLEPSKKEDSLCQWKKIKYVTLLSELQNKQEIIIEASKEQEDRVRQVEQHVE